MSNPRRRGRPPAAYALRCPHCGRQHKSADPNAPACYLCKAFGRHIPKTPPRTAPAPRECLSCDRTFLSEGPWNRTCPRCAERNADVPRVAVPVACAVDAPDDVSYGRDNFDIL